MQAKRSRRAKQGRNILLGETKSARTVCVRSSSNTDVLACTDAWEAVNAARSWDTKVPRIVHGSALQGTRKEACRYDVHVALLHATVVRSLRRNAFFRTSHVLNLSTVHGAASPCMLATSAAFQQDERCAPRAAGRSSCGPNVQFRPNGAGSSS